MAARVESGRAMRERDSVGQRRGTAGRRWVAQRWRGGGECHAGRGGSRRVGAASTMTAARAHGRRWRRGGERRRRGGPARLERKKKGARPTPQLRVLAGPAEPRLRYRVCSNRNACALSDWALPAVLMLRNARAVLASAAVLAPRTGMTWSRYSVTAL